MAKGFSSSPKLQDSQTVVQSPAEAQHHAQDLREHN